MDYNKLKSLIKSRKTSIKKVVEAYTDMSEVGFHQAIKNNSLTIRVLESIADGLGVPVSYFFEDDYENSSLEGIDDVKKLQKEIISLQRELIQEKERNIRLMEKLARE